MILILGIGIIIVSASYFIYHQRYFYFFYYKVESIKDTNIDKKIIKFIKLFFLKRGHRLKFFEPYTTKTSSSSFLVFGTSAVDRTGKVKRNILIFTLELYAHFTNPELFPIDNRFKHKSYRVNKNTLHLYRIPKTTIHDKN